MIFSSKANTLLSLTDHQDLNIPPCYVFTTERWKDARQEVVEGIRLRFPQVSLAIRSSCACEDQMDTSGAGAYTSVLFVDSEDCEAIRHAIDTVIGSYQDDSSHRDNVLVQPMIQNIRISGVIMTRVLTDGSPYYVINYNDCGKVDAITGGREASKTVYIFREAKDKHFDSIRLRAMIVFARRLEFLCGQDNLDIEFCIDSDDVLYLLQVRPICTHSQWIPNAVEHVRRSIGRVVSFLSEHMEARPYLSGQRAILGVMPDWNPAEMIGVTPRKLASSLYRELITRSVWREAREMMGYRQMPPCELMLCIAGRPYIDVRVSFNSFLPRGLDQVTESALVGAWIDRLDSHPHLHDKVEFEVAQTALDFCFDQHLDERYPNLLTSARREEFRRTLHGLTARCLRTGPHATLDWAFEATLELRNRQSARPLVDRRALTCGMKPLSQIELLCDECRKLGTLPFSVLARHAFIAESLLRTAVKRGAIDVQRLLVLRKSIQTVSGQMSNELIHVCRNNMDKEGFLHRYGHLRPSSYDILSLRYLDREGLFLESDNLPIADEPVHEFAFTDEEKGNLGALLREARLDEVTPETLLQYARLAVTGRELAKFVFTRNLSDVLELLALWGESIGLCREELSNLDVRDVTEWTTSVLLCDTATYFRELAAKGREQFDLGRSIKLGYIIRSSHDVYIVPQHRNAPNFVGHSTVEGQVVRLYADSSCVQDLKGRIVCIENADPGFDWIFTRGITGLVTMFGGANSHMAIRCAEYGLPAAIGAGERLFLQVSQAQRCLLNAEANVLKPL